MNRGIPSKTSRIGKNLRNLIMQSKELILIDFVRFDNFIRTCEIGEVMQRHLPILDHCI